ncbi:thioredoxin-disulfide reductase [Acidaminobacter sp. JC074]|uniref:thioredoxin-disulfide reductase n=1 Tax=Acidaminobacter sp. JC074 TaxID=2530199 RepID=UPI001F116149|nr:thioredoxin-disulfide reductase [Acidaminobacter sp. JC074]MCH4889152.1 thioredoxin-disulfide reductase [Acidaminobacter sp. JC074]
MSKLYDVIIIGAGPAGLAAGLYAARAKMSALIIEKDRNGGQIVTTDEVANYPGGVEEETGPSLIARMVAQTEEFGAERVKATVVDVNLEGDIKVVKCEEAEYQARAVIIATGASPRKLGCPGEQELTGKGVSYCATCDADFFTDFEVFAIGGGDTAVEEAMFLTKFARKVTLVHRRGELRAAKSIQEKAFKNEKIEIIWNSEVAEVKGDGMVESIVLRNRETGELTEHHAHEDDGTMGVFVFVGYIPQTGLFTDKIELDKAGYILTDVDMKTNVEGVYAAGDVRQKTLRQVVTAVADGAIAAVQAEKYIDNKFH